jgi:uncharacterized protein YxeA
MVDLNSILQNLPISPVTLVLLLILIAVIIVFAAVIFIRRRRMNKVVKMSKEQIKSDIDSIKQEVTGKPYTMPVYTTQPSQTREPDFELERKAQPEAQLMPEIKVLEEQDIDNNYRSKLRNLIDTLSRRREKLKLEKKDITDKNMMLKQKWEEILREEKEIDKILSTVRQE